MIAPLGLPASTISTRCNAAWVQPIATATEDARKPYEAPKLLKKRSVARATLITASGPASSGLTMMG